MTEVTVTAEPYITYNVPMTPNEHSMLAYIADRYPSAEALHDGSTYDADRYILTVPESVAHNYLAKLPEDNGDADAVLPPLAGGSLAEALIALYNAVV